MEQIYIASAATIWHMRKSTFERHVNRLNFNRKCVAFLARIISIWCKSNQGLRASIDQSGGCKICARGAFLLIHVHHLLQKIRQTLRATQIARVLRLFCANAAESSNSHSLQLLSSDLSSFTNVQKFLTGGD
jgi:hypothetical protein